MSGKTDLPEPSQTARQPDLAAAALLVFGPLLLIAGLVVLGWNMHFISRATSVEGKVIELVDTSSPGDSSQYKAIVSYEVSGTSHTGSSRWNTNPPAYEVGENVVVLYDPEVPSSMMLDTFFEKWFISVMFLGTGAFFAITGLLRARRADAGPRPRT